MCFVWFSLLTAIISLNSINKLIYIMVKWGVLFEVRTEFLNIIYTSFGFNVINHGTKFCRLKPLLPTILTYSLPFYPYQRDERALPGYLLTRCSFYPLRYKAPLAFTQMFSLFFYSYTILYDSLGFKGSVDIRLQWVNKVSNSCVDSGPLAQF
jgi:hypothetical protein